MLHAAQPRFDIAARFGGDRGGAGLDPGHGDAQQPVKGEAVLGTAPRDMRGISTGDQRLVGVQPVLTQLPPNSLRSMIATDILAAASRPASGSPTCPVPMTIASKRWLIGRKSAF